MITIQKNLKRLIKIYGIIVDMINNGNIERMAIIICLQ